ncbi:MAG TPA: hypothetical protein VNT01_04905 [Symbiobacteriaceae bacterium]|nr:hypothetical protein [Symbiobacteriaceae bacterium]
MKKLMALVGLLALLAGCSARQGGAPAPDLTIEEHAVTERGADQPTHFAFNDRIPAAVKEKRAQWRQTAARWDNLPAANAALSPLGYELVAIPGGGADLHKGQELIVGYLSEISPVAVSENGKDFAFVAYSSSRGSMLVRPAGIQPWEMGEHYFQPPVFAGNELIEVKIDGQSSERFVVLQNGKEVYRGVAGPIIADLPLRHLAAWNSTWVVEIKGDVILGGKSQKQALGYEELFDWRLVAGSPFYFFRKDGKVGINYGGKDQGARYDEVVHYMCCEPAMFNPAGNEQMVWFYARKGEMWYYVEAGVFR